MERLIFPVTKKEAEKSGRKYSSEENKKALFPSQLRDLRKEKGISQETLARDLGVSKSTIGLYETGDTLPDAKTLYDLAEYFDVSADWLIGLSNVRNKNIDLQKVCKFTGLSENTILKIKEWNNPFEVSTIIDYFVQSYVSDAIMESLVDLCHICIASNNERKKVINRGEIKEKVEEFSGILEIEELLGKYSEKTGREYFIADIHDQRDLMRSRISRLWEEFVDLLEECFDGETEEQNQ